MHGLGNDYVYVDCTQEKLHHPEEIAKRISDRRFGIGSDGLILICPSEKADFEMRMFNADGSEGVAMHHPLLPAARRPHAGLRRPVGHGDSATPQP
ncbi:MAG: hypothetical protein HFG19_07530, partial [Oscillospiraceae bacterium]|nr:hypothetical protein [Oscillospiraceae bacterium]